jgi:hypothetical protein
LLLKIKLVVGRWLSIELDYSFGRLGENNDKKLAQGSLVKDQSETGA